MAAVTVAVHHLGFWLFLPESVFNYEASIWVVVVHAGFVVIEAPAACFIARSFFDTVIGLEKIVQARTAALDARNRDMHLVLDNVQQGFFTINNDGIISNERSRIVGEWLGEVPENTTFAEAIRTVDARVADMFALSWEMVIDGFMPLECSLDTLPKTLNVGERIIELSFQPIVDADEQFDTTLVIMTDVTAQREQERMEAEQREVVAVFQKILADKIGFLEFFQEGSDLVAHIRDYSGAADDATMSLLKRQIHTLKGNGGLFGLHSLAAFLHVLESRIEEKSEGPTADECAELDARWTRLRSNIRALIGESDGNNVELDDSEYEAILDAVLTGVETTRLASMVCAWKLEPMERRLGRIAGQAKASLAVWVRARSRYILKATTCASTPIAGVASGRASFMWYATPWTTA